MSTKAVSGHAIVEGILTTREEPIKFLLNCNVLGSCHHGLGLSLEARVEDAREGMRSFIGLLSLAKDQRFC